MVNTRTPLIAGNWKMNGSLAANQALLAAIAAGMADAQCDVAVAVPAPYLAQVQSLKLTWCNSWWAKASRGVRCARTAWWPRCSPPHRVWMA